MEVFDLDAFIAGVEESAPQDETRTQVCQECDSLLQEVDGEYVCTSCSAHATNILQIEDAEMCYDEFGRGIYGQMVKIGHKRARHTVDYGWAWSTDEAIVHILDLQLDALEKVGLTPDYFRQGVKNMWYKFWVDNVQPFIKDEYDENDLMPISAKSAMKFRDIEVLFKVKDQVMVPGNLKYKKSRRSYRTMGARFYRNLSDSESDDDSSTNENHRPHSTLTDSSDDMDTLEEKPNRASLGESEIITVPSTKNRASTVNLDSNSISILTLNRTLAFIEAAARCLDIKEPIFASDIIRACNQRLIPFFGAHKVLPEDVRLNAKDALMFKITRPPSPDQLTKSASLLIHKVYHDRLPVLIPVPNLNLILKRYLDDMNLPIDLINHFEGGVGFSNFRKTRPTQITSQTKYSLLPQYDRWAFAILLSHMKRLFSLDDESVIAQSELAKDENRKLNENYFVLHDWIRQMTLKLELITSYDPYAMFHPMTNIKSLQNTPQVCNYVEAVIDDKVMATTRLTPIQQKYDNAFRIDLIDFLRREIPKPTRIDSDFVFEQGLDKPVDVRHPIKDAFERTKRFWISEIDIDHDTYGLLFKDFTFTKILPMKTYKLWSIYDSAIPKRTSRKIYDHIPPGWPYCFKLLLHIGAYLCYCEPTDLLLQIKNVEEFLYPQMKIIKKKRKNNLD